MKLKLIKNGNFRTIKLIKTIATSKVTKPRNNFFNLLWCCKCRFSNRRIRKRVAPMISAQGIEQVIHLINRQKVMELFVSKIASKMCKSLQSSSSLVAVSPVETRSTYM